MREIEFRGLNDCGDWCYGFVFKQIWYGNESIIISDAVYGDLSDGTHNCVEPKTVGQYTGLKDKNGTKIFEGDIVQALIREVEKIDKEDKVCTGRKVKAYWSVEIVNHMTLCGPCFYGADRRFNIAATRSSICNNDVEVVGNIYQNPELVC